MDMVRTSMQADEGQHSHNHYDKPDEINDAIHERSPLLECWLVSEGFLLLGGRHFDGQARAAFLSENACRHQHSRADKNDQQSTDEYPEGATSTVICHDEFPCLETWQLTAAHMFCSGYRGRV
jgi:hypothetical protein